MVKQTVLRKTVKHRHLDRSHRKQLTKAILLIGLRQLIGFHCNQCGRKCHQHSNPCVLLQPNYQSLWHRHWDMCLPLKLPKSRLQWELGKQNRCRSTQGVFQHHHSLCSLCRNRCPYLAQRLASFPKSACFHLCPRSHKYLLPSHSQRRIMDLFHLCLQWLFHSQYHKLYQWKVRAHKCNHSQTCRWKHKHLNHRNAIMDMQKCHQKLDQSLSMKVHFGSFLRRIAWASSRRQLECLRARLLYQLREDCPTQQSLSNAWTAPAAILSPDFYTVAVPSVITFFATPASSARRMSLPELFVLSVATREVPDLAAR
ncbi:hypothetical protein HPB52_007086 [Rhipicephalus sanguineus]|uniref:Uncharacterized protein n=1 Tax=Rhipicephalus sanguineus TaxID=34632 RepID=A0A9D4SPW3_RHISA|nr:hypothetical protein HPB52_007086 [Rhipicephalus sanguineus]